ncbi:MAG TPA: hypothetical protein VHZ95_15390, partial [Polyangiales bacterium]|nr:hypothetical protein [Polyangiales bacterium]
MSRGKPPLSPDETSSDGTDREPPPSAAPFGRTIYGNPHANSTASPAPLRPFQPPPSAPAPPRPFEPAPSNPPRTPAPTARPIADLQRTMIGMPSDLARALAQVRPPSPPPSAAAPQRIIQVGQPAAESTSARPPASAAPTPSTSTRVPVPPR